MLDDLLENSIIELLAPKQPEEIRRTNDLKYYRYHRVIIHPVEKCITLKERIMQLAREGRIIVDLDDSARAIIFRLKLNALFHHGNKALCDLMSRERVIQLPPRERVYSPFNLEASSLSLFP